MMRTPKKSTEHAEHAAAGLADRVHSFCVSASCVLVCDEMCVCVCVCVFGCLCTCHAFGNDPLGCRSSAPLLTRSIA